MYSRGPAFSESISTLCWSGERELPDFTHTLVFVRYWRERHSLFEVKNKERVAAGFDDSLKVATTQASLKQADAGSRGPHL